MAKAQLPERTSAGRLATLKRRSEFLIIRKGARCATPAFVLEGKRRGDGREGSESGARFGFTVTKQVGTAVERNRIRRRLKAAVRDVVRNHSRCDFDYVLIARRAALDAGYAALVVDLTNALERVHAAPAKGTHGRAARSKLRLS